MHILFIQSDIKQTLCSDTIAYQNVFIRSCNNCNQFFVPIFKMLECFDLLRFQYKFDSFQSSRTFQLFTKLSEISVDASEKNNNTKSTNKISEYFARKVIGRYSQQIIQLKLVQWWKRTVCIVMVEEYIERSSSPALPHIIQGD